MALALTYTHGGSTSNITSMPGSPSAGDTISMSNGTQMLTWTYNNHATNVWFPDAVYYSADGTNYYLACYCRDGMRWESSYGGAGDNGVSTNGTLSILSATASLITLQWQWSKNVSSPATTITQTVQITMNLSTTGIIVSQWLASSAQVAIGANQRIADWGMCCFSFGVSANCSQMYDGVRSPSKTASAGQSHRIDAIYYEGNAYSNPGNRRLAQSGNGTWRSYAAGMAAYAPPGALFFQPSGAPNPSAGSTIAPFANGMLHTIACNPSAVQTLMTQVIDPVLNTNQSGPGGTQTSIANSAGYPVPNSNLDGHVREAELEFQYMYQGMVNWFKTIDGAYQSQHDLNPMWMRAGTNYGNQTFSGTNMPAATSNTATDGTALYLQYVYALMPPPVAPQGNRVPKWCLPYVINYWMDQAFSRPNVGGTDTAIGGQNAYWQTLATLGTTINPLLASTYTLDSATYGYGQTAGSTQYNSVIASLAIQALARHVRYNAGNGTTDATTMIDKLAAILVNFQQTSGVQAGAIYKIRHNEYNPAQFGCMEGKHPVSSSTGTSYGTTANTDEPHVSAYAMAEAVAALLDYYNVRGNQTLGSTTCAAALDAACNWLLLSQQPEGGWLPCTSATNGIPAYVVSGGSPVAIGAFKSTSYNAMNKGFEGSGAATIDLAASLYRWAQLASQSGSGSGASAGTIQKWINAAQKAAQFVMDSENVAHGCYEYGEDYNTLSHYGTRMLTKGFARMGRYTGNQRYIDHALYYFEQALLMCRRADEVLNNFSTGGHDIHTGCLISTIDATGGVAGEGTPDLAAFLQEIPALHPSLQSYHWFYLWGWLAHITWSYRNATTQTATIGNTTYTAQVMATSPVSDPSSYAYITPGGNGCGFFLGMDDTHFQYFPMGAALLLASVDALASSSNTNVLVICAEAGMVTSTLTQRTIIAANPQRTSQTFTLTVKGQAGKSATQDGSAVTTGTAGSDLTISGITLTAGQVSTFIIR